MEHPNDLPKHALEESRLQRIKSTTQYLSERAQYWFDRFDPLGDRSAPATDIGKAAKHMAELDNPEQ